MKVSIKIGDIDFSCINRKELFNSLIKRIDNNKKTILFTPNTDHVVQARLDSKLRNAYKMADFAVVDSKPIQIISKILPNSLPERIAGVDLVRELCQIAENRKYKVFFLGSTNESMKKFRLFIEINFPKLKYDFYCPKEVFTNNEINKRINQFNPEIVFVAFGCPKQELWITKNVKSIKGKLFLGIGGSFDILGGTYKRAPEFIQNIGFEWVYRIIQNPMKLFKRYLFRDVLIIPVLAETFLNNYLSK